MALAPFGSKCAGGTGSAGGVSPGQVGAIIGQSVSSCEEAGDRHVRPRIGIRFLAGGRYHRCVHIGGGGHCLCLRRATFATRTLNRQRSSPGRSGLQAADGRVVVDRERPDAWWRTRPAAIWVNRRSSVRSPARSTSVAESPGSQHVVERRQPSVASIVEGWRGLSADHWIRLRKRTSTVALLGPGTFRLVAHDTIIPQPPTAGLREHSYAQVRRSGAECRRCLVVNSGTFKGPHFVAHPNDGT